MRKIAALILIASHLAACGSQTTYRLRSGHEVDAEIVGRIDNTLYINTDEGKRTLDACEVADVSHPGKAVAITGTALLAAGAVIGIATLASSSNNRGYGTGGAVVVASVYSVAFIATGASLAGWGYSHWNGSDEKTGELPAAGCGHWQPEEPEPETYTPYNPEVAPATGETPPRRRRPSTSGHSLPPTN
jgi:hypothetical protein